MEFSSFSSGTESAVIILGASLGTLQDGIMTLDHVERLFMEISSKEYVNHGEDFVSATVKKELPGAMTGFFYYANWKLQSSPATKRWEKIPPLKDGQYYYDIMVLAFDPRLSPHYNVVAVSGTMCMVLSSETGGWLLFSQKKFPDFGLDADADATRYSFHKVVHVFFNGILHLLDK